MSSKKKVLISIPNGKLKVLLFPEPLISQLSEKYELTWNNTTDQWHEDELCELVRDKDAYITSWGSCKISNKILSHANNLKFIGHIGGTIKWLVDEDFFTWNIPIANANIPLCDAVAEYCLMMFLYGKWDLGNKLRLMREGGWADNDDVVPSLNGSTIGLIGYGTITRALIKKLRIFDVTIKVYSRHCSEEQALADGFVLSSLDDVLACDIVSIHMTSSKYSQNLIDEDKIRSLRDGSIFVNTSRSSIVDYSALEEEVKKGRITAILDVFPEEPLSQNSSLRGYENAVLTPHLAGCSLYARHKMTEFIFNDLENVLLGKRPIGEVTLQRYLTLTPK